MIPIIVLFFIVTSLKVWTRAYIAASLMGEKDASLLAKRFKFLFDSMLAYLLKHLQHML